MSENETPDLLGAAVEPILAKLEVREQRVLLAVLERMAAEAYRGWAGETGNEGAKARFMKAAANEDGIADILEALDSGYATIEADLHQRFPQLDGLFGSVLEGRPREEQLALQRAAEAGAAVLFKSFADAEYDPEARQKLMACSQTEQENADFLTGELGGD